MPTRRVLTTFLSDDLIRHPRLRDTRRGSACCTLKCGTALASYSLVSVTDGAAVERPDRRTSHEPR